MDQTAVTQASEETSSLRGAGGLKGKVEKARLELLDLSTRNRLLHTPRGGRAKTVEVVHELAKAMYQTLVIDGKRFTFVPGKEDPKQADATDGLSDDTDEVLLDEAPADPELIAQPDFELDENGRVKAHWDAHLTTRLTPTGLQKRLLDLYADARTLQEEQGVNVLYLAVGYLRWRATSTPQTDRFAPLVLIPVQLERSTAGEKFHLKWIGDDIQANLSLQLFLQREFGLRLPLIDEFETLDIDAYMTSVEAMLEGKETWGVLRDDAILGLFSFAKFMMYRDLDPQSWEALGGLEAIPMLRGVVQDGFPGASLTDEDSDLDRIIPPEKMRHVVDCDSSQALVVHDVLQGNNILVQGPPGTGKSQTIANIISAAVAEGKRVLFVAEKMAALEVVKRRLDYVGVGVACLELHSNKANKRSLLEEFRQTLNLGDPKRSSTAPIIEQLTERRDMLNAHVARLHEAHRPSELTPYKVFGQMVRLRRLGYTTQSLPLEASSSWAPHEKDAREALLRELLERIGEIGLPDEHAWSGVQNDGLLPNERDRLLILVAGLAGRLNDWEASTTEIHGALDLPPPVRFDGAGLAVQRVKALLEAPKLGSDALQSKVWDEPARALAVIDALESAQKARVAVQAKIKVEALVQDWDPSKVTLTELPGSFLMGKEVATLGNAHNVLVRLFPDLTRLTQLLAEKAPLTLDLALRLVAIAERATSIPELDRDALVAHIWERGVDAVEEIVVAVETVQQAKSNLASVFREAAWSKDSAELEGARGQLAMRGSSVFRFLSGDWRRANQTVRTLLSNPKLPAADVLGSLDVLLDAKSAQKKIAEHDAQGQEAFGSNWERERSNPSFLRGVVAWMRTLRPLGSGVRERLADIGDRVMATEIAKRVKPVLEELGRDLASIHEVLVSAERNPWGEETVLKRVALSELAEKSALWQAASEQSALLVSAKELAVEQALSVIDEIQLAQAATSAYDALAVDGDSAFGPFWLALDSKAHELRQVVSWIERNPELRLLAVRVEEPQLMLEQAERASFAAGVLAGEVMDLLVGLQFEGNAEITRDPIHAPLVTLNAQLASWQADPEGLRSWVAYLAIAKEAKRKGLSAIVDGLANGKLARADALGVFELSYYEAVLQALVQRDRALASFDGQRQSQVVASFASLDQERMQLARYEVVKAHHSKIPRQGGATGPTAILIGEMAKKKGHLPIRQLMQKCAPAIQALKPVFMMSPLSVAQFLPAGALDFDMLVIDEASQVQPIDALGAIARAKQLVIVGDERQLPPTRFFSKALGDSGERDDDEGGAQASDVESILGLCRARGLPERMLRWHYRSRHQSLIAVSNQQFYEGKLFIVPSPYTSEAGVGLRLHHLPEAIYDRGNTRTNPKEAKAVALAVLAHAQNAPKLTLGVATFSTAQRRAILDELELLRRQHPETEGFFADHPAEPFFVKSLENIQGDERDVIYISVGYGRDAQRHMTMNFGPVSNDGGERRLNVLISRAKSRCEVFTSITDEDIDTDRAKGKGTFALKLFLNYARTGRLNLTTEARDTKQSVFEQEVATALRARGYDLHTDVGLAGFFVDIAVSNPEEPGRYILGIECDGPSYRDARSARDRDRLRESVLRDKGWQVYRVWSSDWFHRPEAELEKLIAAIERAKAESGSLEVKAKLPSRAVPVDIHAVDRGEVAEMGLIEAQSPPDSEPYIEASFAVPSNQFELHLVPTGQLATIVRQIVEIESPIHRSEVVTRVRTLWGLQRAGSRIQQAVEEAIRSVVSLGGVQIIDQEFLVNPNKEVRVRDRLMVGSLTLRRPEFLPPSEIDSALIKIVKDNLGAKAEELVTIVSRQLGYKSTSPQLGRVILDRCEALVVGRRLMSKGDLFVMV
ncbi:DNA helicase [Xanthomonas sp. Leaf131]|nr:DNA helicase [Xanthomonas sp. Leaf131]